MKKNILILADTRQQKDKHITDYFDKQNIEWVRATLRSGDYMTIKNQNGFLKIDYSTIIDTKKDMEEIAHNLCNTMEHERIKREVQKAKELGCKQFIFLICDDKIKTTNDIWQWTSKRTKVTGKTLYKIMATMHERYDIDFMFISKQNAGAKIVELLSVAN